MKNGYLSVFFRELWVYWVARVYRVDRGNRTYNAGGQENHFSEISCLSLYRVSVFSAFSVSVRGTPALPEMLTDYRKTEKKEDHMESIT